MIVRELLIRLGFVTDKQAINQTNRAIVGFKTRFAIAASAATFAFSKVAGFFDNIANSTIEASNLADALGISITNLVKLNQASQSFGFKDGQFGDALNKSNKLLVDFRNGLGALPEIARQLKIDLDPQDDAQTFLNKFLKALDEISSFSDRKTIASRIYGDDLGSKLANLSRNLDAFTNKAESFNSLGESTQNSLDNALKYRDALIQLQSTFTRLGQEAGVVVFPALTKGFEGLATGVREFTKYLDAVIKLYGFIFGKNTYQDFLQSVKPVSEFIDNLGSGIGNGIRSLAEKVEPYTYQGFLRQENLDRAYGSIGLDRSNFTPVTMAPVVNNNITVNSNGTPENNLNLVNDLKEQINNSIYDVFNDIQYNFPEVE